MGDPDFSAVFYFIAVFGGPVLLGLAFAYALLRRRRRRSGTPGELREGHPRPHSTDHTQPRR